MTAAAGIALAGIVTLTAPAAAASVVSGFPTHTQPQQVNSVVQTNGNYGSNAGRAHPNQMSTSVHSTPLHRAEARRSAPTRTHKGNCGFFW
ncbi:MAG: hypothetical protein AB7G47_13180 [Mycolicibacterium sp.]|uniref:hypothetical protein n=1 Tax=Mycolicibacterium sp. TaxID=2320850 RepID=UPI003D0E5B8C